MVKTVDIHTGKKRWECDRAVAKSVAAACCDVGNRDKHLIALDTQTGTAVWSAQTIDSVLPYTTTSVPRIIKDKVIIGSG